MTNDLTNVSFPRVALRGLLYHWRVNVTVALGVAAATAVLTGALLVGDSVRGSLRDLTIDRLGTIDEVLVVNRFFRQQLVTEIAGSAAFKEHYAQVAGVMLFPEGTVEFRDDKGVTRSANVLIVGNGSTEPPRGSVSFWDLAGDAWSTVKPPKPGEIVLNQQLASELGVQTGDRVTVRLPKPEDIPADSPLGEKTDRIRSLTELVVTRIVPNSGLGQFDLRPSQGSPRNAFISLEELQDALDQPARINAVLVAGRARARAPGPDASAALAEALHPSLADLGLVVKHPHLVFSDPRTGKEGVVFDYFSISSERMILPPEVEKAAQTAFAPEHGQPVFTYLANLIERVTPVGGAAASDGRAVPYSMVTGIDPSPDFSLLTADGKPIGPLRDNEIILTSWLASQLSAAPGDQVEITYFRPETTHEEADEALARLRVKAITPLTEPEPRAAANDPLIFGSRPTAANDPDLTPVVTGITDQQSIDDWEVPFTIDYDRIQPPDDAYWQQYRTTPKAYVSLATGRRLWGSRFGRATSYRIPAAERLTREAVGQRLLDQLARDGATLGFSFMPIKRRQLAASSGNTPFDVLFLSLSFFIIAAALMLVSLLFRLGFEQRARQTGLLLAVGWRARRVRRLLVAEGLGVSVAGGIVGVMIGLGYAWLMLAALRSESWWLGAITTPFLRFHVGPVSLIGGFVSGVVVSTLTIMWSVYQTRRIAARSLLAGQALTGRPLATRAVRWPNLAAIVLILASLGLAVAARSLGGEAQAGAFVGSGAAILTAILLWAWNTLRSGSGRWAPIRGPSPVVALAARSAARNPGRSTLTIGLIAAATFLIVAMSAFQLKPSTSGTGGFSLVATSSQPIFADLNTAAGRDDVLGEKADVLDDSQVFSFRVRPGDNASCGNLYQAIQPRVLGVPDELTHYFDQPGLPSFHWAASAADSEEDRRNPWRLLAGRTHSEGDAIPVVVDKDTAMYSLHLYKGIGEEFPITYDGRQVVFRVVGLLDICVLHGNLLIGESDFQHLFPEISGHRYFLIKAPQTQSAQVARVLEDALGDQGFDARDSTQVLTGLLAIQNTYLRTFQSLGALGLLLGTFGLAAVQLRSVLERRGEMALLRASGFRRARLAQLVLAENIMLLVGGLAAGVVSALVSVLPHMWGGGAAVPFGELATMLVIILAVGIIAGSLAARATLRAPLLEALRQER